MRPVLSALIGVSLLLQLPVRAQPAPAGQTTPAASDPITILVTDPLSKELACDCVAGYAQRRYDALAMVLQRRLGQPVNALCGADIAAFWSIDQRLGLIVGKSSDVLYQTRKLGRSVYPLAALSDREGKTTFQGLFVVRKGNAARTLSDLNGYRVIYGPPNCDEKHRAAAEALHEANVAVAGRDRRETVPSCTDAANILMKLSDQEPVVAVISDYAQVLLEGCHTIPPGSLRVIGKTGPLPFVTVFATDELPADLRRKLQKELFSARQFPTLLKLLESKDGFRAVSAAPDLAAEEMSWTDFRGARRDGLVSQLPETLDSLRLAWTAPLQGRGLGGMAVTPRWVLVTDRAEEARTDYLKMLELRTGELRFTGDLVEPAGGLSHVDLDYGNSVRTTPVVVDRRVFLLDAFGAFYSWEIPETNSFPPSACITGTSTALLVDDFDRITWGLSSSPLVVRDEYEQLRVVINSCGASQTLLALDPDTLAVAWKGPGRSSGYASCILGTFGGRKQIIGYDQVSLGGWDPETGERIWSVQPEQEGDFNVPTPVALDAERLLVVTESNGMRVYAFDPQGVLNGRPVAVNEDISHDTVSPVAVDGKAYCTSHGALYQVETSHLKTTWTMVDSAFNEHVSLIADRAAKRLLIVTYRGELLLFDIGGEEPLLVSRRAAFRESEPCEIYSHPSLAGNRLLVRGLRCVKCFEF